MSSSISEIYPEPYALVQRKEGGFWEISKDPASPEFHPTIIMSMCTGIGFPPYRMAGMSDVVTYLRDGTRTTHLNGDNTIFGFRLNASHQANDMMPRMCKRYPKIAEHAQREAKRLNESNGWEAMDPIQFAKDAETLFGKFVTLSSSDFTTPVDALEQVFKM